MAAHDVPFLTGRFAAVAAATALCVVACGNLIAIDDGAEPGVAPAVDGSAADGAALPSDEIDAATAVDAGDRTDADADAAGDASVDAGDSSVASNDTTGVCANLSTATVLCANFDEGRSFGDYGLNPASSDATGASASASQTVARGSMSAHLSVAAGAPASTFIELVRSVPNPPFAIHVKHAIQVVGAAPGNAVNLDLTSLRSVDGTISLQVQCNDLSCGLYVSAEVLGSPGGTPLEVAPINGQPHTVELEGRLAVDGYYKVWIDGTLYVDFKPARTSKFTTPTVTDVALRLARHSAPGAVTVLLDDVVVERVP